MKKLLGLWLVFLTLMITVSMTFKACATTTSSWLMFQHDPQHTGYTSDEISSNVVQKWNFTSQFGGAPITTPVVADDLVFFGTDDGYFFAVYQGNGTYKWWRPLGEPTNSPAVDPTRHLVFIGVYRYLYARDTLTGNLNWSIDTDEWHSAPIFDSEKGILTIGGSNDGGFSNAALYDLNETNGVNLGKSYSWYPDGIIFCSPASDGTNEFVGSYYYPGGGSYVADGDFWGDGWHIYLGEGIKSSASIGFGFIYVGGMDGNLYSLYQSDGETSWFRSTKGPIESSPAIDSSKGLVIVGSDDSRLYCFRWDGAAKWNHTFNTPVVNSPVITANSKVVISVNDTVYALDEDTGNEIWRYKTGGRLTSVAIANDTIFVGSADGHLYALSSSAPIPEFPSILILPLLIMTTLLVALICKKEFKKAKQTSSPAI